MRVVPFAAALLLAASHATAFDPPPPGSYALPPIQQAPRGEVIDETGNSLSLERLLQGRIVLLGLVYTHCNDPEGCPRATWAFGEVRKLLRREPALERRVRLLSLSFDPAHDDARAIAEYALHARGRARGAEWRFLTTRSDAQLAPILEALGQDVSRVPGSVEAFEHTVKVFLVDDRGRVREIYSSAYLMPAMIVNDIRTLDREPRGSRPHS
jgi:protein SCO1/2